MREAKILLQNRTCTALLFGAVLSAPNAIAQVDPVFLNWVVQSSAINNRATIPAPLYNISNRQYLRYGSRTFGINLEWDSDPKKSVIRFQLPNFGSSAPNYNSPRLGDLVAIHVRKGGYLKYEKRSVGVDLSWSTAPSFEWYVVGVGAKGSQFGEKMTLGLLNAKKRDFLVHQNRSAGINLGWAKDKGLSYMEGRRFIKNLRDRGFNSMADLLKRLLDW